MWKRIERDAAFEFYVWCSLNSLTHSLQFSLISRRRRALYAGLLQSLYTLNVLTVYFCTWKTRFNGKVIRGNGKVIINPDSGINKQCTRSWSSVVRMNSGSNTAKCSLSSRSLRLVVHGSEMVLLYGTSKEDSFEQLDSFDGGGNCEVSIVQRDQRVVYSFFDAALYRHAWRFDNYV